MAERESLFVAVPALGIDRNPDPFTGLDVMVSRDPAIVIRQACHFAVGTGVIWGVFKVEVDGNETTIEEYFYVDKNGGTGPFLPAWGKADKLSNEAALCARAITDGEWRGRGVYHVERA